MPASDCRALADWDPFSYDLLEQERIVDISLLIPLLALSIPIIAIVSAGATKRAQMRMQANQQDTGHVRELEARVIELEREVRALNTQMIDLGEQQTFTTRMLEKNAGK